MADKRIIDFPTLTEADDDDLLLISSQNDSYNIKVATLKKATNEVAAKAVEDAAAALDNTETMQEQLSALNLGMMEKVDGGYVEDGYLYLTADGDVAVGPLGPFSGGGGGGGGGGENAAVLTVRNDTGWLSNTIAYGASCPVSVYWTSIEDETPTGDGSLQISVNGTIKATRGISQGSNTIDLIDYLSAGSNTVKVKISDVYGNSRTINFTINCVLLTLDSSFDEGAVYDGAITFPYTPGGKLSKTMHFVVDGTEIETETVTTSGHQMSYTIPAQTHGSHTIRAYFTCEINGQEVSSPELFYDVICTVSGQTATVITSRVQGGSVSQYATIQIPYRVYNPSALTADVTLSANGTMVSTQTVDRTEQVWAYRPDETGTCTLTIASGGTQKTITITVTESEVTAEATTEDMALYLTSYGRSNNEEHPEVWTYGSGASAITAALTGFNFVSDGWQMDADGITVMRVAGDARVSIPYKPFAQDFRSSGKTIEIEFATRDVMDYDAVVLSCMSGDRGISLTAQKAVLKSELTEISAQYKENEHIRISIVIEKSSENRLAMIYIDGIPSGVVQYPSDDDFSQGASSVDISIGSEDCTIDIYNIRIYDNDLTRYQILDNWIADTQVGTLMLDRFQRNNIYDDYGQVVISKLPQDLPYMILEAAQLPQYKGDKKTVSGSYTDPMNPDKSFTFTGCQINVQGTSSAVYTRKNYDLQFKSGFEMANGHADNYALRSTVIPFNRFVLKADVASSEGANNVELVRLFCDTSPFKTREMVADSKVRQGIDGFPIVVFWSNTDTGETSFLGKFNFNLPKRAPEPYGYSGNMESWEFQNNTSNLMLFKSDYFDETMYTDPDTGDTKELWRYDYEARFPSDAWTDYTKLQELQSFVYSTYRAGATGDALDEAVTYGGVEYTSDTAAYRLAKFKAEFGNYAEVNSFLFYYIFTELFLMVDSRAKNLFIGFSGSDTDPSLNLAIDRKAVAEPYDMDTAVGTNNEGSLVFSYNLEDTDHLEGGANVFNGQESVLWCNIRDAFDTEIRQMYQTLRSQGILSYANLEQRYEEHQSKWPEAIWIEDAWFKYIDPLISPDPGKEATDSYLAMMQGSKEQQRKWWLTNRFKYMDSKWVAGDARSQIIELRGYAKDNITITPYADIYPTVKFASYTVQERGHRGQATTIVCPSELTELNDTEIHIYSAPQISDLGDLSGLKVGRADFSMATRIQSVKLGDASQEYENANLGKKDRLTFGNNVLLKTVDVRNCTALGTGEQKSVDLSGCTNIEEAYFDGTAIAGLALPNGGVLKKLHLPGTIANLTVLNQGGITEFVLPSYSNITTLRLENVAAIIPSKTILMALSAGARVRLIGFYWEATDAEEIDDIFTQLDLMRGMNENGLDTTIDQAISGTIHTSSLTGAEIAEFNARYPHVSVTADHTSAVLTYKTYDGATVIDTETVYDGGNGTKTNNTARASTAQYSYTPNGWATAPNGARDNNALVGITADRTVYAAYTATVRTYSVYFYNGSTLLQTVNNVPYGGSATYTGSTPVSPDGSATDYPFEGWNPAPTNIQGNTSCYARFGSPVQVAEISDSWDTIIANIDNGTYRDKYKVGNYKPLNLGAQGTVNMQIVAFDTDNLADNTGKAPITWISKELLASTHRMNPSKSAGTSGTGTLGGWGASEMRTYLRNDIKPLIPNNVRSRIVNVSKVSKAYDTSETEFQQTTTDDVWIPGHKEIFNSTSYDTSGPSYNSLYNSASSRIKNRSGSADNWWLRSAYDAAHFRYVSGRGYDSNGSANSTFGVALGFCT